MRLTPLPPGSLDDIWTCYGCGQWTCEPRDDAPEDAESSDLRCPHCGTHDGDGFGMAENDPEWPKEKP